MLTRSTAAVFALLVTMSVGWTSPAKAQGVDSASSQIMSLLRDAENRNRMVRVHTTNGTTVARPRVLSNDDLRIGQRRVSTSEVISVDVRFSKPDPPWNGSLVGALVGGLVLGGVGISFAEGMTDGLVTTREKLSFVGGGAVLGFFIGIGVDSAFEDAPEWRTMFTRAR
jgi:hypothetical protein